MQLMRDGAAGGRAAHGRVADYVDDDVVVISGPEFKGFVVVPRLHVTGWRSSRSVPCNVLAAVQRAARAVREEIPVQCPDGRTDRPSGIGRPHVHSRASRRRGRRDGFHLAVCLRARTARRQEQRMNNN